MRRPGLRVALLVGVLLATAGPAAARLTTAPGMRPGIWLAPPELDRLPMAGAGWQSLLAVADEPMGHADLSNQDSDHDVHVLAAALVYARTGESRFRSKAAAGIIDAIDTEKGGRTLSLARGLSSYVVAADLIDLHDFDAQRDERFRTWLSGVRTEVLKPESRPTLIATHERAANNWGTHAGASRIAADVYLGDRADLRRAAAVFKGWTGDRAIYKDFVFGDDRSWQVGPNTPAGLLSPGAEKQGHSLSGALPDDMRRGCSLRFPPCPTLYAWEAMQGVTAQANMLARQGYDSWNWGEQGVRRAASFLFELKREYGDEDWGAPAGNTWIPWLLNARYGTSFPTVSPTRYGKALGFADWTAPVQRGTTPRGRAPDVEPIRASGLARDGSGSHIGVTALLLVAAGCAALAMLGFVVKRVRIRA